MFVKLCCGVLPHKLTTPVQQEIMQMTEISAFEIIKPSPGAFSQITLQQKAFWKKLPARGMW